MTKTTQKLIQELEKLPEEKQEELGALYLRDLNRRMQAGEPQQDESEGSVYEPFQIMLDADLDLPADYSESYEERLYGDRGEDH